MKPSDREAYRRGYAAIDWRPLPPPERKPEPAPARAADLACPRLALDGMPATEHIDGKFYDSKSAFRAVTKAHGCIEVGNDPARLRPAPPPKPDRRAIKAAIQKAYSEVLA